MDPELTAIHQAWKHHALLVDAHLRNPERNNYSELSRTVTADYASTLIDELDTLRMEGVVRAGQVVYRNLHLGKPVNTDDGLRISTVTVCADSTGSTMIDSATGKEADPEEGWERVPELRVTYSFHLSKGGRWLVAATDAERGPC